MTDWLQQGSYANALSNISGLFDQRAQFQAGSQLAQGDYGAAAGSLLRNGNLQQGLAVQGAGVERQNADRTREQEDRTRQFTATLRVADALENVRRQGGDVMAAYQSYQPVLSQLGTTPEQFAQMGEALAANPDQFISGVRSLAQRELEFQKTGDTLNVFEAGNPDPIRTFSPPPQDYSLGTTRFSGETNQPVAQGYIAPEIIQQDPTRNIVEISPGVQPGGVGGGGGQPRGLRNNNPGNIEDGAFAQSLPGYVGSDGRFAIFDTPEAGNQAAPRLLQSYISRGFDTPGEIINRWAPPSDNNPTPAYAQYVAGRLGIGVDDRVTPEQIPALAQAIREFENGERGPSQGASAQQPSGPRVLASATAPQGGNILTPDEVAAAGLAPGTVAQRNASGQVSILQAGPAAASRNRPTEAQNKDSFNANRMVRAGGIINTLEDDDYDFGRARLGGQFTGNFRRYDAAAEEWTDSILRLTTGAAATANEIESNRRAYFPLPGDDAAVRAQKRRQREAVERDALARGQGGASSTPTQTASQTAQSGQTQQPRTNAPGLRFNITEPQLARRQALVQAGARPNAPLGGRQNPRYINPADPNTSFGNVRRGEYFVTPDGQLRGPKP